MKTKTAWKIPLFRIYCDEGGVKAVTESIRAGMNWATCPNVGKFEGMIVDYVGTEYAVTFNSWTSALHASLLAHGRWNDRRWVWNFHENLCEVFRGDEKMGWQG